MRVDPGKTVVEEKVAKIPEKAEQRMVCLYVVLDGQNWAKTLTHLVVTEYKCTVDDPIQQLGHDAVNLLRRLLEGAYLIIRVLF